MFDVLNWQSTVLLFTVALLGGTINGVAGGGGLVVFPTLLLLGMPPIQANATNTASLWVGTVASTFAYREAFGGLRRELVWMTLVSLVGGLLGTLILLELPQSAFTALLPYLMLTATLLFAFGQPLIRWVRQTSVDYRLPLPLVLVVQFLVAIYIGFFGGGAGIVMLAMLELMGFRDITTMNALKTWLAACTNGIAILAFMAAHAVIWSQAALMAMGALLGGYSSAYFAQQIKPIWVRSFVISIGSAITVYLFARAGS
ncbi:MAG: sulfite exporter TauE/SafE family protein [Elainella sp.]